MTDDMNDPIRYLGNNPYPELLPTYVFGERLRKIRLRKGLSLRVAASQIGVPHSALVRWEKGAKFPKEETLEKIAKGLNCLVAELLPGGSEIETTPDAQVIPKFITELEEQLSQCRGQRDALRSAVTALMQIKIGSTTKGEFDRGWMRVRKIVLDWQHKEMTTLPE